MPNRATELEWETPVANPLRTEIVDAALQLADEHGLDAVSIRRVAEAVGMRPMSVYSHVPSKDGLIALMFDRIGSDLLVPEPLPKDGRALLEAIARRTFETYLAHPWMLLAFGRRPATGPNHLRRGEQSAKAVDALGVPPTDAWAAVGFVHEWVMGHAIHVATLRADASLRETLAATDPGEHPAAAAALRAYDGDAFDHGLAAILDAVQTRFGR